MPTTSTYDLYGLSDVGPAAIACGVPCAAEDRDAAHSLPGIFNSQSSCRFTAKRPVRSFRVAALKAEPCLRIRLGEGEDERLLGIDRG